jgi:hypothetical protein
MGMTMFSCMSRISLGFAATMAIVAAACDKAPLVAPTESTLTLSVTSIFVPTGGTTEVSAYVVESAGTPVQNGTTVLFTTNLGRFDPAEAQTRNGVAVTTFIAGDASGLASIRAFSGSASAGGSGDNATDAVEITVGSAAVETVLLAANPGSVPSEGGTVDLLATVTATNGRSLPGILVTFTSSEGTLANPTVVTDASGQARTTLTTTRTATVTATAGAKTSSTVTVTRRDPPSVATATISATPGTPTPGVGQTVSFTANLNVTPPDAAIQATRYQWNFGDGSSVTTNGNTTSHAYTSGANSPRVVAVQIDLTNGQTLMATTEILLGTF